MAHLLQRLLKISFIGDFYSNFCFAYFLLFFCFFWFFYEATGITGYFSNTLFVFRVIADVFEFAIGSLQLLSGYNISTVGLSFVL